MNQTDTIVALSTPPGTGALAVIRLSGEQACSIASSLFRGKTEVGAMRSHTLHYGTILDGADVLDEVVLSIYRSPHSFTGEDVVEITCHGSSYIIQRILSLCVGEGARPAGPGEFTQRAFLAGRMDLSQAESVADIIASENKIQHSLAMNQMRGGYSALMEALRNELIGFAALMELELDFSEEDVEFADRTKFRELLTRIRTTVEQLIASFEWGNVLKQGIPVAIVGEPNVGKSTLLNALLKEDKAMVSDIAGTTRDFIEDVVHWEGIMFRFIDTAGLRETGDTLEGMGIERSYRKLKEARMVLYLADIRKDHNETAAAFNALEKSAGQDFIIVLNKSDQVVDCNAYDIEEAVSTLTRRPALEISAFTGRNLDKLQKMLIDTMRAEQEQYRGVIVSNTRHATALRDTLKHILQVEEGMAQGLSGELLAIDIKLALLSLGSITGSIDVDRDILGTIFGKFCIGK